MSNKSSPPSRSPRATPDRPRRRPRSARSGSANAPQDATAQPVTMKERLLRYLPSVGIPNLVMVLALAAGCLAAILLSGGRLAALPAAIAECWFVLHGVPVTLDGVTLGAIPLLPALVVVAFIARRVRMATRERVSVLDLYAIFGLVTLGSFTLSAIAWFMVADASSVFPVEAPVIHKALFVPVFVHLVGMGCGISGPLWSALAARLEIPIALIDAIRATNALFLRLAGAAAAVFVVLLALGHERIAELVAAFPSLGVTGGAGLAAVCVLYVPNAVLSMLAVLLGAPFEVADGGVSLFSAALVPLPPLPLFGAIPGSVAPWAPVLFAVPATVIIHFVVNRRIAGLGVFVAGAWSAVLAGIAGLMSGGEAGAYSWIGPNPWFFALAAGLWVSIVSGIAWAVAVVFQPGAPGVPGREEAEPESRGLEVRESAGVAPQAQQKSNLGREAAGVSGVQSYEPGGGSTALSVLDAGTAEHARGAGQEQRHGEDTEGADDSDDVDDEHDIEEIGDRGDEDGRQPVDTAETPPVPKRDDRSSQD